MSLRTIATFGPPRLAMGIPCSSSVGGNGNGDTYSVTALQARFKEISGVRYDILNALPKIFRLTSTQTETPPKSKAETAADLSQKIALLEPTTARLREEVSQERLNEFILGIAEQMVVFIPEDEQIPLFERLFLAACYIDDNELREGTFLDIASRVSTARLGKRALPLFENIMPLANPWKITGLMVRAKLPEAAAQVYRELFDTTIREESNSYKAILRLAPKVARIKLPELAISLFEELIDYAQSLPNEKDQTSALNTIAVYVEMSGLEGKVQVPKS